MTPRRRFALRLRRAWAYNRFMLPRVIGIAAFLSLAATADVARADEEAVSAAAIRSDARTYYAEEITVSWLFGAFGAVTAGTGALALSVGSSATKSDFAHGFGWSSLIAGGSTMLGALGYGVAVLFRGRYFEGLAATDLARFKREESEHIAGTDSRFWLYLGTELLETAAGAGIAVYGIAAKSGLAKGIGAGVATQGIGLFVIDVPGAARASKYRDRLRRFRPDVGFAIGGGSRPWAATLSHAF